MGLIQKKDDEEREVIEGVEIIERSDVPDDLPQADYDLVAGESAEDIAAGSADETGDGTDHAEPAAEGDGSEQEAEDAAAADDEEPADASGAAASPSRWSRSPSWRSSPPPSAIWWARALSVARARIPPR